jgi:hypothetical protein
MKRRTFLSDFHNGNALAFLAVSIEDTAGGLICCAFSQSIASAVLSPRAFLVERVGVAL